MRYLHASRLIVAALSLIMPAVLHGQQGLLTGDAQINSASTGTNYGTSSTLAVNASSSTLLNFDVLDILPSGVSASQVTRARLIVFTDSMKTSGTFNVYPVTSSWTEKTVTYANKPSVSSSLAGSSSASASASYVEIAITDLVQSWISTPSSNHGVELKASGSTSFTLDSKENTDTSHPAILQVDLSGPAGPQGPAGATGAKGATGATGARGPAGTISLPYSGSADGNGNVLFTITNEGTAGGGGLYATGANAAQDGAAGGAGIAAQGGSASAVDVLGGIGVLGYGGDAQGNSNYDYGGGAGGRFLGGYGPSGSYGGDGIDVYGGGGADAGGGGDALYAYQYGGTAGLFEGNVIVEGNLSKQGGSFRIDDPLDPANKYLSHSFVESPDMMNIYNGNVITDNSGYATVTMPAWFEALNRDFRYQLTPIGQFAQAMIASKLADGKFSIRTDKGNVEVSWMITGIRQDAWANAHRIPVEEEKPEREKGHYTRPELFGHSGEPSIAQMRHPLAKQQRP